MTAARFLIEDDADRRAQAAPFLFSRRSFLASGSALFAMALLPRISSAAITQRDWLTTSEAARRTPRVLTEPLGLGKGELLADLDLIVPRDFRKTGAIHAVTAHPAGNRIRNVRILFETDTWLDRWQQPLPTQPAVGISSGVSGLCLPATADMDIDGLHVEGAPRFGIEGWDLERLSLRRYSSTRCYMGASLSELARENRQLDIDQVRCWDTWGPPGGYPSRVRPGGWVGGDGWVSRGNQVSLRAMEFSGEMWTGAKICRGRIVQLSDITTPSIMFQGSSTPDPALPGLDWLYVRGLFVNAATGYGIGADLSNKVQISSNVVAQFDDGYIIGNGRDGNAIQVTGNCHVVMRGFAIGGFQGQRGSLPACALELDVRNPASTINSDFESVNTFVNQDLILRRAT